MEEELALDFILSIYLFGVSLMLVILCIEPWDGLPDFENPNLELSKKEGINSLKPGEEYLFSYEMEFID